MNTFIFTLALVTGANAIIPRWNPCCFHLSASGAVTGTVGQLGDGQNRVNGPLSPAEYCIADGSITDANGRGCILTRKSSVLSPLADTGLQSQHPLPNSNAMWELLLPLASVSTAMEQ